jgi:hypothetical protein
MKHGPGKRVGAGLSLDKFAKAGFSSYDKRKVIAKQMALKSKQFNKYKRLKKRLEAAEGQAAVRSAFVFWCAYGCRRNSSSSSSSSSNLAAKVTDCAVYPLCCVFSVMATICTGNHMDLLVRWLLAVMTLSML